MESFIQFAKNKTVEYKNTLTFEGSILTPVDSHKHLGLIIQHNGKWDKQINAIVTRCCSLVSCLKSYKYRLSRKSLEIMYTFFILPIFDYADVVWGNCSQAQTDSLENIQLDALRTISGSVRGTSHEILYQETGFKTLKKRREQHKLTLFFKNVNGLLPYHINIKFPQLVSEFNPYHKRRPLDRMEPLCRTDLHKQSFFPSSTALWNLLPDHAKQLNSIGAFKYYLKKN